jgi:O-antigen/teichoic acid export membrane protein
MILVKALFTPEEAGAYAAAAVLGKVILFLPGAIPLVMFPKLSREYALGYSSSHTLRIGLLAVALMCTMPAIVLLLVPRQLVYLVFGLEYEGGISLVGPYAIAMLVYALLNVLVQYYTSISSKLFSIVLIVSMTLQIGLITLFHQDLRQVIFAVAAGGTLALLLGMMLSPLVKMYKVFGA